MIWAASQVLPLPRGQLAAATSMPGARAPLMNRFWNALNPTNPYQPYIQDYPNGPLAHF